MVPGKNHGIWYTIRNNKLSIEWITTRYSDITRYFHFMVEYDYSAPNIYTYYFFEMDNNVGNNVIGVQKSYSPPGKSPVISAFLLVVLPALFDGVTKYLMI